MPAGYGALLPRASGDATVVCAARPPRKTTWPRASRITTSTNPSRPPGTMRANVAPPAESSLRIEPSSSARPFAFVMVTSSGSAALGEVADHHDRLIVGGRGHDHERGSGAPPPVGRRQHARQDVGAGIGVPRGADGLAEPLERTRLAARRCAPAAAAAASRTVGEDGAGADRRDQDRRGEQGHAGSLVALRTAAGAGAGGRLHRGDHPVLELGNRRLDRARARTRTRSPPAGDRSPPCGTRRRSRHGARPSETSGRGATPSANAGSVSRTPAQFTGTPCARSPCAP